MGYKFVESENLGFKIKIGVLIPSTTTPYISQFCNMSYFVCWIFLLLPDDEIITLDILYDCSKSYLSVNVHVMSYRGASTSSCGVGLRRTRSLANQNSVEFTSSIGGTPNPLRFNFNKWYTVSNGGIVSMSKQVYVDGWLNEV